MSVHVAPSALVDAVTVSPARVRRTKAAGALFEDAEANGHPDVGCGVTPAGWLRSIARFAVAVPLRRVELLTTVRALAAAVAAAEGRAVDGSAPAPAGAGVSAASSRAPRCSNVGDRSPSTMSAAKRASAASPSRSITPAVG